MRSALIPTPPASRRGFSVVELLLAVTIMTVIVIGLYTVFDQTQKAMRSTMSQVDVLEGVRATTDIVSRDVEGAMPIQLANTNLTSLAAYVNPVTVPVDLQGLGTSGAPLLQTTLQDIFFVTRQNDVWTAIGYWVGPVGTNQLGEMISVGRLYRYQYRTNTLAFANTNLFQRFNSSLRILDSQPVMDGVVHMRLIAYAVDGTPLLHPTHPYLERNRDILDSFYFDLPVSVRSWFPDPVRNTETAYNFRRVSSPTFPASLELEIAVVEPQIVSRFTSIPVAAEARKYLARNSGQIHLFRQRIPLRNAPVL